MALERFARDGFAETTVRDIASDAGVAPRTFFHYFDTKEDVVLADFMGRLARLLEDLRAQPDEVPPLGALWNAMELLAGSFDASPEAQEHYRLIVAESFTSGLPLLRLLDESLAVLCTATASMCAQNG